jgi:Fe-S oxidoreductase
MASRRIHLINPKADSLITQPMLFGRALFSPLTGLLAVAALIPEDRYEVILTDENIEPIDYDAKVDMVGISAMTCYVNRGYEIADAFRRRGVPVVMGGVHPSFMPMEALDHADAVVVGEAELVMHKVLEDLEAGCLKGIYKAEALSAMDEIPLPRYSLMKSNRYFNRTFVQTARGCHHACAFCAEHMMYGLKFRFKPVDHVVRDIEACGDRLVTIGDADFFGVKERALEVMRALKGRGIRWQAGVNTASAHDEELLEAAAESGCYQLCIGFESMSKATLRNVHKYQNKPEDFLKLVEKIHGHGMMVLGLFMFGFDGDDPSVFDETAKFTIDAGYDSCAYSIFTPYPGTVTWYEMVRAGKVVSCNWDKYDQSNIVYQPENMSAEELRDGYRRTYKDFYSWGSMAKRFPLKGARPRGLWTIYNLFYRQIEARGIGARDMIAPPTPMPAHVAAPPLTPRRSVWREMVAENHEQHQSDRGTGFVTPADMDVELVAS